MEFKVGIGYDSHRFVKGRKCILGGVDIPYEYGLQGHSDADALLHAIADAILGAMGKGDIGQHFPDTDPFYKDADSKELLKNIFDLARQENFMIGNIDAVVLAQEPSLKPFKQLMAQCIADILEMDMTCVNVKATTNEGMGFIGRKEGIACYATVSLVRS